MLRVLIVGASPLDADDATGITIKSLFADWPQDALAQVCWSSSSNSATPSLPSFETRRAFRTPNRTPLTLGPVIGAGAGGRSARPGLRLRARIALRAARDFSATVNPPGLRPWVESRRPDLIYALGGSVAWFRLALRIGAWTGRPVVFHFLDDWPATIYREAVAGGALCRGVDRVVRAGLRSGPSHFVIGETMASEYTLRYGRRFLPFMRCLETHDRNETNARRPAGLLRLVYCGGLHLGRWRALAEIGRILSLSPARSATLTIFAPESHLREVGPRFASWSSLLVGGSLAPGEERSILSNYDVAVHAESFEPRPAAYARLSLSTKIPLYFAAGLPVLAVGPASLASVQWIASSGAGIAVSSLEPSRLASAVAAFQPSERRSGMAAAAERMFRTHYDAARVRPAFREALLRIRDESEPRREKPR